MTVGLDMPARGIGLTRHGIHTQPSAQKYTDSFGICAIRSLETGLWPGDERRGTGTLIT